MTAPAFMLSDLARWIACGVVVILAHASAAALVANWRDPVAPGEFSGAITIDLAPFVTSTAQVQEDLPPGPQMTEQQVPPERTPADKPDDKPPETQLHEEKRGAEQNVVPGPVEDPQVEPIPATPKPEVVALPPNPPPKPAVRSEKPKPTRPPAPATTAPQRAPHVGSRAAAPAQGQISAFANAMPSWKGQIVAAIERNKRYPAEAEARREQGAPAVAFSIDRSGRLLSSRLVRPSGVSTLDREALAILHRAQPFPPPPADVIGTRFDFTIPIRFTVR